MTIGGRSAASIADATPGLLHTLVHVAQSTDALPPHVYSREALLQLEELEDGPR